jgi:hypothetical protein
MRGEDGSGDTDRGVQAHERLQVYCPAFLTRISDVPFAIIGRSLLCPVGLCKKLGAIHISMFFLFPFSFLISIQTIILY